MHSLKTFRVTHSIQMYDYIGYLLTCFVTVTFSRNSYTQILCVWFFFFFWSWFCFTFFDRFVSSVRPYTEYIHTCEQVRTNNPYGSLIGCTLIARTQCVARHGEKKRETKQNKRKKEEKQNSLRSCIDVPYSVYAYMCVDLARVSMWIRNNICISLIGPFVLVFCCSCVASTWSIYRSITDTWKSGRFSVWQRAEVTAYMYTAALCLRCLLLIHSTHGSNIASKHREK